MLMQNNRIHTESTKDNRYTGHFDIERNTGGLKRLRFLAWGVSHGRQFLGTAWYRWILTGCGVLLIGFGLVLLWQGVSGLGLI